MFHHSPSLEAIIKLILPRVYRKLFVFDSSYRPTSDRSSSSTTIQRLATASSSIPMSTSQDSATYRTYPLSPSPNSELRKSTQPQPLSASFGAPRTPQSPLNGQPQPRPSAALALATAQLHNMHDMNSHSITGTEASTTSPLAVDANMNGRNDDGSLKRKHEFEENGEHKDKKLHVEDRKPCISDLHIDVGKIYQLCRTRKYSYYSNQAAVCARELPASSRITQRICMNYG